MASVDEVKLNLREVALIGMCAIGREDFVVLAPDDQGGRPVFAEVGLNGGIERQVGAVIIEDVHLNVGIAGPVEQRLIVDPVVRRNAADVGYSIGVLELRGLRSDQHV
jgi:hypothetical protein